MTTALFLCIRGRMLVLILAVLVALRASAPLAGAQVASQIVPEGLTAEAVKLPPGCSENMKNNVSRRVKSRLAFR